jgi:hypothetical protein
MRQLVTVLIFGALAWFVYSEYQSRKVTLSSEAVEQGFSRPDSSANVSSTSTTSDSDPAPPQGTSRYRCDGRTYCSQMTSCDEAKYFLANCPGVKMDNDGHGDGVPCERQWCGNR